MKESNIKVLLNPLPPIYHSLTHSYLLKLLSMFIDLKSFEIVCSKWAAKQKSYKRFCLTFALVSFLLEGIISHPLIGVTVEHLGISPFLSLTSSLEMWWGTIFPFTVNAKKVSIIAVCLRTLY